MRRLNTWLEGLPYNLRRVVFMAVFLVGFFGAMGVVSYVTYLIQR